MFMAYNEVVEKDGAQIGHFVEHHAEGITL
jgi:hypothetical protein